MNRRGLLPDYSNPEVFWRRIVVSKDGCWLWTGSRTTAGYGDLRLAAGGPHTYAHRVAYEMVKGPIPTGLHIDHLCRVRHCVNPEHLEAVTNRENTLRGLKPYGAIRTTCKRGHDITDMSNVRVDSGGRNQCRACDLIRRQPRKALQ